MHLAAFIIHNLQHKTQMFTGISSATGKQCSTIHEGTPSPGQAVHVLYFPSAWGCASCKQACFKPKYMVTQMLGQVGKEVC